MTIELRGKELDVDYSYSRASFRGNWEQPPDTDEFKINSVTFKGVDVTKAIDKIDPKIWDEIFELIFN
jgi:hypothetical protein